MRSFLSPPLVWVHGVLLFPTFILACSPLQLLLYCSWLLFLGSSLQSCLHISPHPMPCILFPPLLPILLLPTLLSLPSSCPLLLSLKCLYLHLSPIIHSPHPPSLFLSHRLLPHIPTISFPHLSIIPISLPCHYEPHLLLESCQYAIDSGCLVMTAMPNAV